MDLKARRLQALRERVREVTVDEFDALTDRQPVLVDIRERAALAQGVIPGALAVGRDWLEMRIEAHAAPEDTVVLCCASGVRSLFAADALTQMGYADVRSLAGGVEAWVASGRPLAAPAGLDEDARARYARQIILPEIGEDGQARLAAARVVLIGAGGLGSPAALYLAAAGVGTLVVIDPDVVDRSNLQRQVLHADGRVGQRKVASASTTLGALNPRVTIEAIADRLTADNADALLAGADVVVDGSDNFRARYAINDAAVRLGVPVVHGAVSRFEGQVSVFWPARGGPCYRCLHPHEPAPGLVQDCATGGVLGAVVGVVGTLQAVEALKVILRLGEPLIGRLLQYDALSAELHRFSVNPATDCSVCAAPVGS